MLAATLLALSLAQSAAAEPTADVIGGTNVSHATYTSTYPFMVGLLADSTLGHQFCGGTLIAPQWVMTAAHCYAPDEGLFPKFVHIGSEDALTGGQTIAVTANFIHPNWNPDLLRNDIQLLRLASAPVPATPVARSTAAEDPIGGQAATLIGWGRTTSGSSGAASRFLKSASVDVIDQTDCATEWNDTAPPGEEVIVDSHICALHYDDGTGSRMACNGDSGGPLLYNNKVVGITSFVYGGCYDLLPNGFTRVSSFNGWIDAVTSKLISTDTTSVGFGDADVSRGTAERTIRFRSDGDQPVTVATGTATGDFAVKSSSCKGQVPAGGFCEVVVTFDPSNIGSRDGELIVSSDSVVSPSIRVRLNGIGIPSPTTSVALKLTLPHASRVKGERLTAKFKVAYALPGATSSSCSGAVRLSLKLPGLRKPVVKTAAMARKSTGCSVTIPTAMSKSAKGKRARATISFAGNNAVDPAKLKKTIRIR